MAATDPGGAAGTQTFTVVVAAVNNPPTITSTPVQGITAGLVYRYDVRATDPDGDALTFRLDTAPAGMTLDALGRVSWATTAANVGVHRVAVTVADGRSAAVTQSFDLAVVADGQTPRVNLFLNGNPVPIRFAVTFVVTATDNVGVRTLELTVGGVAVPLDGGGRATLPMNTAGSFAVVARATDAAGNTGQASTTLTVIDTSDQQPPTVAITAPADDTVITAPTNVVGTASDATLLFYTLEVCAAAGDACREFARATTPVTNGVLGRFDPSGLANDTYLLRLTAQDAGGNIATIENTIHVAGNLKIGNFTLSFTDLTVPVAGVPITVTRTYDSLNAGRVGAFGFGWRLEFRDTDLRTSLPPSGAEEFGIYNAFREGTRVYVTLPGGRREGFTFRPQRLSGFGGLFAFYSPAFVPDRGVTSRLAVPDNVTLIQVGREYHTLVAGGELAYNPADTLNYAGRYTVTTKDGLAYSIDAVSGDLLTVQDANGNTLTFSETGVVSSSGPRVTFTRDPQGRIGAATDPLGRSVLYQYDARGDLVGVTDRESNVTRFVYSTTRPHFLERVIDPLNRPAVRTEYDAQGRLVRLLDGQNNAVQLIHDPANSVETVVDALNHRTTFEYDTRGNVVTEVNHLNGITRRTYDLDNNLLTETNPLSKTRGFTYDGDGNVLTETDPLGNVTRSTYLTITPSLFEQVRGARPVTLPATTTDALGNTNTNAYAGVNLVSTTDAQGGVTRNTYDGRGNLTTTTDALTGLTCFEYDAADRLVRQTDALGRVTRFTHDANGNPLTQTITVTMQGGPRFGRRKEEGGRRKQALLLIPPSSFLLPKAGPSPSPTPRGTRRARSTTRSAGSRPRWTRGPTARASSTTSAACSCTRSSPTIRAPACHGWDSRATAAASPRPTAPAGSRTSSTTT